MTYQTSMIIKLVISAARQCLIHVRRAILAIFFAIVTLPVSSQVFSDQPERDQERLAQAIVHKAACAAATVLAKGGEPNDAVEAAAASAVVH